MGTISTFNDGQKVKMSLSRGATANVMKAAIDDCFEHMGLSGRELHNSHAHVSVNSKGGTVLSFVPKSVALGDS